MVALSIQAGSMRSGTTDKAGYYKIDGLPPGQYIVFKSRLDERADNIPLELMSNMRLKTVAVKAGKVSRLDIADESEDGVRVFGMVRENGAAVPRARRRSGSRAAGTTPPPPLALARRRPARGAHSRRSLAGAS